MRAGGMSVNASFTFSFLKSAISCPLAKKTHHTKWVLWAGAVSDKCTFPAAGPWGRFVGRKPLSGAQRSPAGHQLVLRYGRCVWETGQAVEVGRFPSYHCGQLGNHVAQRVDVALIPWVSPAQVPGHLAEVLLACGSVVLQEKHTAQSMIKIPGALEEAEGAGARMPCEQLPHPSPFAAWSREDGKTFLAALI